MKMSSERKRRLAALTLIVALALCSCAKDAAKDNDTMTDPEKTGTGEVSSDIEKDSEKDPEKDPGKTAGEETGKEKTAEDEQEEESLPSGKDEEKPHGGGMTEAKEPTVAEYSEYFARTSLEIPENWDFSIETSDREDNPFGLSVFRKDKPETRFQLLYYPDVFGVCGTGLEEKDAELPGGKKVKLGYYDGSPVWSFIVFEDVPGSYAVTCIGESDKELSDEFLGILDSVTLGYSDFGREDAERLAKENVQGKYKYVHSRYDHKKGVWNVSFYNDAALSECEESFSLPENALSPTPKAEETVTISDNTYNGDAKESSDGYKTFLPLGDFPGLPGMEETK